MTYLPQCYYFCFVVGPLKPIKKTGSKSKPVDSIDIPESEEEPIDEIKNSIDTMPGKCCAADGAHIGLLFNNTHFTATLKYLF